MAQQSNTSKSSALKKDQVMLLLDLISSHKVITTKATNATNNKLKDDAWKSTAEVFNASTGVLRRPEQLRLKWENLKKAARKRTALIRQNNLKTGGEKTSMPPDEVLDRVASILGVTCIGFTVEFGGDKEEPNIGAEDIATANKENVEPLKETEKKDFALVVEGGVHSALATNVEAGGVSVVSFDDDSQSSKTFTLKKTNNTLNRKRKLSEEVQMAKRDKDLAMAAYFKAKAEKLKLENEKFKIKLEKNLSV